MGQKLISKTFAFDPGLFMLAGTISESKQRMLLYHRTK